MPISQTFSDSRIAGIMNNTNNSIPQESDECISESDSLPRQNANILRRRPSMPKVMVAGHPIMTHIDEASNDALPSKILNDRIALNSQLGPLHSNLQSQHVLQPSIRGDRIGIVGASSVRVGESQAMRRGAKRLVRPSGDKLEGLEKGEVDYDVVVLYARLTQGMFMLALALGCVLLVNLLHKAVLPNSYGQPLTHAFLALASFGVSMTGGGMVGAGIHHALTIIALTRGADCYIMATNYQTRNPLILIPRALKCTLRNAKDTKGKELVRLFLIGTLLISTWALSLILSFAMVSVEWVGATTAASAGACTKPVYDVMSLTDLRTAFVTATSVSKAIFEDDQGVGVVGSMLPSKTSDVYVTADGILMRASATYEPTNVACTVVSSNTTASPFYGVSPIFCDSSYLQTVVGAQIMFKIGLPTKYCPDCSNSGLYEYHSIITDVSYYTGQISVLYSDTISASARPTFVGYSSLVSGVDTNLATNIQTAFSVTPAYLLVGSQQARQPAMFASCLSPSGEFVSAPTDAAVARSVLAVLQTVMLTYTESIDASCMISTASGHGHASIAQWVITTVEVVSSILAFAVILIMWEARRTVKQVHPHAYVRGLSIMRDPLRFMVSMRDCTAFWSRCQGGCDANGDLLRMASAGLVCKYGEESATKHLEIGHLMFGNPADIVPIRDGREYSGRPGEEWGVWRKGGRRDRD
ncbi:hypothetical protein HKX48_006912 [Thoreauomyces humboldtii]|nr:hypothetical protein HKX48_006912 [Thoreauomyces humboldtii]